MQNGIFKKESLILILILCFPILILTPFTIISYKRAENKANLLSVRENLHIIKKSLYTFKEDIGRYPNLEEGLLALVRNPGFKNWEGPYIKAEQLIDPWKQSYKFNNYMDSEFPSFIASLGRNKKWESRELDIKKRKSAGDDIIEWLE